MSDKQNRVYLLWNMSTFLCCRVNDQGNILCSTQYSNNNMCPIIVLHLKPVHFKSLNNESSNILQFAQPAEADLQIIISLI